MCLGRKVALLFIDEEMKTQRKVMLSEPLGSERMENFPCPWIQVLPSSLLLPEETLWAHHKI